MRGLETDHDQVPQEINPNSAPFSLPTQGVRFLVESQNPDGGWGFHAALSSATEPTAWAVMGLDACAGHVECRQSEEKGFAWLEECQLQDGSWPAHLGQREGSWVTSAACLALASKRCWLIGDPEEALAKGLRWLVKSWPGEGNPWWRLRRAKLKLRPASRRDSGLRGWGWTPKTSGWVEPTALALLALQAAPRELHPKDAQKRIRLGQAMLLDQALATGGWNSGSSDSYGYAARPQPGPTAWALMALREQQHGPEIVAGLDWLCQIHSQVKGFFSFSLVCLCLNLWGVEYGLSHLENAFSTGSKPISPMAIGWALLAITPPEGPPGPLRAPEI
ncbi:MAG TPA: prenyltransferase/squalene oxidase repeat-containing protein [Terriglobia bacterium]|nr:prenyltransferase/squalene oxidase repeat-containing protein [Terriglobia bacterium]